MLHGVEVTRLDHGVELPDRAQRGVRRGRRRKLQRRALWSMECQSLKTPADGKAASSTSNERNFC